MQRHMKTVRFILKTSKQKRRKIDIFDEHFLPPRKF